MKHELLSIQFYFRKFKGMSTAFSRQIITAMIIELLKVKVIPAEREKYLQKDAEIWTQALTNFPGFLGKEVWLNPSEPTEVILIIRWATKAQWKSISPVVLDKIERQFAQQVGNTYQIIDSTEYQVYEFSQP